MDDDWHPCHFCGTETKDGKDYQGNSHLLQDCRPDLVEHEIGDLCTWPYLDLTDKRRCYGYQNISTLEWTNEHVHFYPADAITGG